MRADGSWLRPGAAPTRSRRRRALAQVRRASSPRAAARSTLGSRASRSSGSPRVVVDAAPAGREYRPVRSPSVTVCLKEFVVARAVVRPGGCHRARRAAVRRGTASVAVSPAGNPSFSWRSWRTSARTLSRLWPAMYCIA